MNIEFFAFGEILWDCLPSGRHAGGAPFNVTCHIAQLGATSALISSVGQDALGDEILEVAGHKRVQTQFITRARLGLDTGTVIVTVNEVGNASYELVQPAAWDEIRVTNDALKAVVKSGAFVFGSLAGRSPYNLDQLHRLLEVEGPLKFFDVNLRPPFADPPQIVQLAQHADVIKLNHEEVGQLASWLLTGEAKVNPAETPEEIANACAALSRATNTPCICVSRGPNGAALWSNGDLICAPAPKVEVKDTVGAGDAFMAGLIVGLTRKIDPRVVLESACRLGAFVASHHGATPLLPPDLVEELTEKFSVH